MPVYLVEPDPFAGRMSREYEMYIPTYVPPAGASTSEDIDTYLDNYRTGTSDAKKARDVARPIYGMVNKPDTHAVVQVIDDSGKVIRVFNKLGMESPSGTSTADSGLREGTKVAAAAGGSAAAGAVSVLNAAAADRTKSKAVATKSTDAPNSDFWTDWILSSVREDRVEKTQVIETFGANYLYAFGQKPRALSFDGLLFNTQDFNWRSEFWLNWDRFFRATKLIEQRARLYITWDDIMVEGYPLNASAAESSGSRNSIVFSFTLYVTNYTNLSAARGFPLQSLSVVPSVRSTFVSGTPKLDYERKSLLEMLNLTNLVGPIGGDPNSPTSQLLRRTLQRVQGGAFAALRGETAATNWLRGFITASTRETLQLGVELGTRAVEDAFYLKRGEINAWFGQLARVLNAVDSPGNFFNMTGPADDNAFTRYFKLGSVNAMVDALAYATADALTEGLPLARPSAMGVPKRSGSNASGVT